MNSYIHKNNILDLLENNTSLKTKTKKFKYIQINKNYAKFLNNGECSDEVSLIVSRLQSTFEEIARKLNNWHYESAKSSFNILSAIYLDWLKSNNRLFILSKSHASIALYTIFLELGYIKPEDLESFAKPDSKLQSHPEGKSLPTILVSTGSLGQSLSIAAGIAIAYKIDNKDVEIAVLLGDGELNEGQVWEAVATISHNSLNNIILLIDKNGLQLSGETFRIKNLEPLENKFEAFGWFVLSCNGSSAYEISKCLNICSMLTHKPKVIICETKDSLKEEVM
jgi:transketolase